MQDDPDATITLRRPARRRWIVVPALVGGACIAAGATFLLLRPTVLPPPGPPPTATLAPAAPPVVARLPTPVPPPTPVLPALATEAEVLGRAPGTTETFRFAPWPAIVIVQFGSLADQADALNRAAAMIEKAGMPRDRVLEPAELDRRIREKGDTPETYYYGHDYRTADLFRFFDTLGGQMPTGGESGLRAAMTRWGWQPGTNGALITLAHAQPGGTGLDAAARAAILRHELSHGLYFTDPAYARHARTFWNATLTEAERARFRAFLANEGYDTTIEDLVVNETQAYLVHTPDARYFNARAVGLAEARIDALRALFVLTMPPSWLRDCTAPPTAPRHRPARAWSAAPGRRQRPARRSA